MTDTPTVHEAWAAVLDGLPPIGKTRRNQQQGFAFRGVDDVLDHLNPLLGKHGCHIIPVRQVAEREERPTAKGGVMHTVYLTADWRIYGPAGDYFEAQTLGEGTDSGDKATSKAQTMAFKYLLWPSLAIAENDATDTDGTTPAPTVRPRKPPETIAEKDARSELMAILAELPEDERAACAAELKARFGPSRDMTPEEVAEAIQFAALWPPDALKAIPTDERTPAPTH